MLNILVFDIVGNEQRTTVTLVHDRIERPRSMKLKKKSNVLGEIKKEMCVCV